MKSSEIIRIEIKRAVLDLEPAADVLLFGSQARGDADSQSDYDLLIITSNEYTLVEKTNLTARLNRSLVHAIGRPVDVLLTSKKEFEQKKELPGHIFRTAAREGVLL